jgi:sarcosine oxidase delta subunit
MSYFANWDYRTYQPQVLRMDTRIYWGGQYRAQNSGRCVGTFVGENPGAAHGASQTSGWDKLVENESQRPGDKTLRFIREVWVAAVKAARKSSPHDADFIEVLNTYYFRCPKAGQQLNNWRSNGGCKIYFQQINPTSKFVILGWGKEINNSAECAALLATLGAQPILFGDVKGAVKMLVSPIKSPVDFYPAQPSAIAQRGNNNVFLTNLADALAIFV